MGASEEATLRAELDELRARLAQLEAVIASSPPPPTGSVDPGSSRLATDPVPPTHPTPPADDAPATEDRSVDRRSLLRRGGLVAGAVAGGAAASLLSATPAAAVTVSGSGNPGVLGTGAGGDGVQGFTSTASANGVYGETTVGNAGVRGDHGGSGIGVLGLSATGTGVYGNTTNGSSGVLGAHGDAGTGVLGTSTAGVGVEGQGAQVGVRGISVDGHGVYGSSSGAGHGVVGTASTLDTFGVWASNPSGTGLLAESSSPGKPAAEFINMSGGIAVNAASDRFGMTVAGGGASTGAHLVLIPTGPAAPTRTGAHVMGEIAEDTAGDLWVCVNAGVPGTWRKLAGPATAGAFHPLATPVRIYDSRTPGSGGIFTNTTRTIDAKASASGVPAGATAVLVNLAVTNTNSGGFGALWTNGVAWPGTANINWGLAASTISNSVVTAVDATALFQCRIAGTADVIIDVIAYYR